jgi:phosphomannomutase
LRDCRHNSDTLAKVVQMFFRQIEVFLFSEMTYAGVVFAVKHLGCQCGIVLTVSHNPPEYNGYKVYQDGGQIVPPDKDY